MLILTNNLAVLLLLSALLYLLYCLLLEFVAAPENVTVCDAQSLPQVFGFSCSFLSQVRPTWFVDGLLDGGNETLSFTSRIGSLSYTMGSPSTDSTNPGVATLTIDRSAGVEVTVGTCFNCQFPTAPITNSDQGCVEEIREL